MANLKNQLTTVINWTITAICVSLLNSCAETIPIGDGEGVKFDADLVRAADAERGGRLFDKWWAEKAKDSPKGVNPVWSERAKVPNSNTYYNNQGDGGGQWRCKECHGWDYQGQLGAYSLTKNPARYTGINGLNNQNTEYTEEKIFTVIANGLVSLNGKDDLPHQFLSSDKLSTNDIYDLTKFIYDFAKPATGIPLQGDTSKGKLVFESTKPIAPNGCASTSCHKENLAAIIEVAKTDPEEFFHKVRFGSAGEEMPGGLSVNDARDLRAFVAAGATSNAPTSNFSQATYDSQGPNDVVKGGLLYDKWWKVATSATEPAAGDNHPLWPATNTNIKDSGTWRCKECHGWDYRGRDGAYKDGTHYTGFAGIVSTTSAAMTMTTANNVYSYLKTVAAHGFADTFFTDDEYYDLTKFIMTMRTESAANTASFNFIDNNKQAISANTVSGKTLFESTATCSTCHGTDGKKIDFEDNNTTTEPNEFVHNIAQENPWEFVHKVRFGEPGSSPLMPGLYNQPSSTVNKIQASVDILGYSQTALVADTTRAGLLYDKWWTTEGVKVAVKPTTRNPIWVANPGATTDVTKVANDATWRCKQCHGWDYLGKDGAYKTGTTNYSGISGFTLSKNKAKELLTAAISEGTCSGCSTGHAFKNYLSAADIDLLVSFIQGIASPTDYNAALSNTNVSGGQTIYKSETIGNCESCHGTDGKSVSNVDVKAVANENPQEFLHKVRYGQPSSTMTTTAGMGFSGLSINDAGSVLAYSKTLAVTTPDANYDNASLIRGGRLYDEWWAEMKTNDATVTPPKGINPFYTYGQQTLKTLPALAAGQEDKSWRCKTCHAWNYKGVGYYSGSASDSSGADNLIYKIALRLQSFSNDNVKVRQHFFDWIKSGYGITTHQFGVTTPDNTTPMKDQDIWDVVKFLLDGGLINTDTYILSSGVVIGTNITNGNGLYNGSVSNKVNCSSCHGVDGDTPPTTAQGGSGAPLDIFGIAAANDNPWEFVHKVRFGQPGTPMPGFTGISTLKDSDAYDVLGYAQKRYNDRLGTQIQKP